MASCGEPPSRAHSHELAAASRRLPSPASPKLATGVWLAVARPLADGIAIWMPEPASTKLGKSNKVMKQSDRTQSIIPQTDWNVSLSVGRVSSTPPKAAPAAPPRICHRSPCTSFRIVDSIDIVSCGPFPVSDFPNGWGSTRSATWARRRKRRRR
ncbi:hypothetical protein B0H19DRAFT_1225910 [Mycena capillaripes]|nr:hypothetical protein B0H19DRAFT_1225910 [Mycena capillaripes]